MNRRSFVKWLLAGFALLFGAGSMWFRKLFEQDGTGDPLGDIPSAPPSSEPIPTPAASPSPSAPPAREKGQLLLSLFLLSDIHMIDSKPIIDKVHKALKDVSSIPEKSDVIVLGGDLTTYARDSDYKLLRDAFNKYKLPPMYGNMGNHEFYDIWIDKNGGWSTETMPNGKTDQQARDRFQRFMGIEKPYTDAWVNGVHLILLSQEPYVQEKPDVQEGAWYSDEQLAWLKKTLEPHADGSPALVFIHQPLPNIGSDGGNHRLIRANAFREILKPYPNLFVFSGHTHQDLNQPGRYVKETFHWFMNGSVGKTRGELSQGLYIQVYEGAVAIRGREFTDSTWIAPADWEIPLA
jgi:3',5'-cyclic-AMP phosphodiesterase